MRRMLKKIIILSFALFLNQFIYSQVSLNAQLSSIDYSSPKEYEIGGITVSGIKYLDQNALIHLSGLKVGDVVFLPGEDITKAIEKLWNQGLFSDAKISVSKIIGDKIFLDIYLQERPRLAKFSFTGVKKSEADDIREKIKLVKGVQITDNIITNTQNSIEEFFVDKGYYRAEVNISQKEDTTLQNSVILIITVKKKNKIKINEISFVGNEQLSDKKLRKAMKDTKQKTWYNVFKTSKIEATNFKQDKQNILAKYNESGYRDAKIISDTIYDFDDKTVNLEIKIEEGSKYFFRDISWVGNVKYSSKVLSEILGIKKGDVFDQSILNDKLFVDERGLSSLYLDDGYLFFTVTPVEVLVENDSIDLELRVYEGRQAVIDKVIITGNTKTNDHVIRREIRTKPGQLFSRSDIIRSHRELAQLGYFNPEKLDVTPTPNPTDGTVDLEYVVEEKASDQIELSGGWGAGMIVGTLGVSFNNFSAKNFFNGKAWRPLPSGDGQKLSVRAQSNGTYYQAYNMSFVEPWLGGKKPNSLTVSLYNTTQTNGRSRNDELRQSINISGVAVGLGRRLKWPDDYFTLYNEVSFQNYNLNQWTAFLFEDGRSNNMSFKTTFARHSSGPNPIYPVTGSSFSLSLQVTPPYSLLSGKDYTTMEDQDKFKWIEYHKWSFSASWFSKLAGNLVLNTRANFGFLGMYNKDYGHSPFEGFTVGGDGLSGYNLYGRETIAMRGYDNGVLTPEKGGNIYNKITMELRYPLSLNPNATFYGLVFAEGGNAWYDSDGFNPFDIKRSAGVGVRAFLPMFGMLGVDWGYRFDDIPTAPNAPQHKFSFVIGQQF